MAVATTSLVDRVRASVKAFADPYDRREPAMPPLRELAWADPSRLFPGGYQVPYNPSALVSRKGLRLFDTMMQDDQVKAAMVFKSQAVMASGWELVGPEGEADGEDDERVQFVQWVLDHLDETFEDDLDQILTAQRYGFSVTEKIWAPITRGPWAGKLGLKSLKTRAPYEFEFVCDPFGNLQTIRQDQQGVIRDLPREKFLVYAHRPEFSNYYGTSDLEAAYRPWWAKENAYRWFAMALERYGVPLAMFLADMGGYSPQDIADLKAVAKNFAAGTVGVLPRKGKDGLEIWTYTLPGEAAKTFLDALDRYDRDIARALLMPGLLGYTSDAEEGSFARAKVQFDVFLMGTEATRRTLAKTVIQAQIVEPLIDLNFAGATEYPQFRFVAMDEGVQAEMLDRYVALVNARALTRQGEDETHLRAAMHLPELTKPSVADAPMPEPVVAPPGGPFGREAPNGRPPAREGEAAAQGAVKRMRAESAYERHADFAALATSLDGLEGTAKTRLKAILTKQRDALTTWVDRQRGAVTAAAITRDLRLKYRGETQTVMAEFLRATYDAGARAVRAEVPKRHQANAPTFAPEAALAYLRQKALTLSGVLSDKLLQDAKLILLNALKIGEPTQETIRKLRQAFEPYLGDPAVVRDEALVEGFRLETIVRNAATESFNQGRLVEARQLGSDFVPGMVYSAILDERTTDICRLLDGKVFRLDDEELSRFAPPNHHNCRSLLVPVTLDTPIDAADLVTPTDIGRAKDLAGQGFA